MNRTNIGIQYSMVPKIMGRVPRLYITIPKQTSKLGTSSMKTLSRDQILIIDFKVYFFLFLFLTIRVTCFFRSIILTSYIPLNDFFFSFKFNTFNHFYLTMFPCLLLYFV